MSDVVLCNISDSQEVIEEARADWINDIFDALEIPDEVFDVDDIRDYRLNMNDLGIEIVLHSNGEVDVYKKVWHETANDAGWLPINDDQLVAQWKTPERIMRTEKDGSLYYEIHFDEWSIANIGL